MNLQSVLIMPERFTDTNTEPPLQEYSLDIKNSYNQEINLISVLSESEEKKFARQVQTYLPIKNTVRETLYRIYGTASTDGKVNVTLHNLLEVADTLSQENPDNLTEKINNLVQQALIIKQGQEAFEQLVIHNLRLVRSVANEQHRLSGYSQEDLTQEGILGLFRAIEKFEPEKGFRFSTYARWWIQQTMTRARHEKSRTIHLPVHFSEKIFAFKKFQMQFLKDYDREPTNEEAAKSLGTDLTNIELIIRSMHTPLSFSMSAGEDRDLEIGNVISSEKDEAEEIEDRVDIENKRRHVHALVKYLTPREQQVVNLRFGITDGREKTLEEVGKILGVTRERVRQIEQKSLRKLKHHSKKFPALQTD